MDLITPDDFWQDICNMHIATREKSKLPMLLEK